MSEREVPPVDLEPIASPKVLLSGMDASVTAINEVIDGTSVLEHPEGHMAWVGTNVRHLELMVGLRVDELGDSPDLSTYETAITAGNAYVAS